MKQDGQGDMLLNGNVALGSYGGDLICVVILFLSDGPGPAAVAPGVTGESEGLVYHLALVPDMPCHGRNHQCPVFINVPKKQ